MSAAPLIACKGCGLPQPADAFNLSTNGRRRGKCRGCQSAYLRDWTNRNREHCQRRRIERAHAADPARYAAHQAQKERWERNRAAEAERRAARRAQMTTNRILARLAEGPATNADLQAELHMNGETVAKRIWSLTNSGAVLSHTRGPGLPATYSLAINLIPPERRHKRAEQMTKDDRAALIARIEDMAAAKERDVPKLVKDRLPGHAAKVKAEAEDLRAAAELLAKAA